MTREIAETGRDADMTREIAGKMYIIAGKMQVIAWKMHLTPKQMHQIAG